MLIFTIPETLYVEIGKIDRANSSELSLEFSWLIISFVQHCLISKAVDLYVYCLHRQLHQQYQEYYYLNLYSTIGYASAFKSTLL